MKFSFLKSSALALCCASITTPALAQHFPIIRPTVTDDSEKIARFDYPLRPDGMRRIPEIRATITFTWNNPDVVGKYLEFNHKLFVETPGLIVGGVVYDTATVELPPQIGDTNDLMFRFPLMPFTTYAGVYTITGAGDPKTGTAGPLSTGPAAPF